MIANPQQWKETHLLSAVPSNFSTGLYWSDGSPLGRVWSVPLSPVLSGSACLCSRVNKRVSAWIKVKAPTWDESTGGMSAPFWTIRFLRDAVALLFGTATVDFKREEWKRRWMCGDPAGDGEVSEFQMVEAALPILWRGRKSRRKIGRRWVGGEGDRDVEEGRRGRKKYIS